MRGWSVVGFCLLLPATVLAQSASPKPVSVKAGPFKAQCQWGPAKAPALPVGAVLGPDVVQSVRAVPQLLAQRKLPVHAKAPLQWIVGPITDWPDSLSDARLRETPHPLVYAELIAATVHDSGAVIGRIEAVCAVPPSAPDSAIARAQAMMAAQLTAALAPNQTSDH
jgi:hypothetical protein